MTTQTIQLKSHTLTLPRDWQGEKIFIRRSDDTIVIKKVEKPGSLLFERNTGKKLRALGRKITKRDIEEAIKWAIER